MIYTINKISRFSTRGFRGESTRAVTPLPMSVLLITNLSPGCNARYLAIFEAVDRISKIDGSATTSNKSLEMLY